jgi:hypothetical protein
MGMEDEYTTMRLRKATLARLETIAGTVGPWDERMNKVIDEVREINSWIHEVIQQHRSTSRRN